LAALYFFLTISAFLSAAIVHKVGMYRCLVWGSLLTFVFTAVNILPALHGAYPNSHNILISVPFIEAMLMIAAILNGLGGGILWCSLGKYISACATEETKGYYFGVFWFFYMGS
jgi:MFS family permease